MGQTVSTLQSVKRFFLCRNFHYTLLYVPAPADTKTERRKKLSKWQQKLMQKPFS
jgi:hypothetical protein